MRTAVFAVSGLDRAFSHSVVHTMHPAEIIICPGYSRTQASFFMPLLCVSVSKSDFLHAAYIAALDVVEPLLRSAVGGRPVR